MSASVEVVFRKEHHDPFSNYPYGKFTHKYRLKTCKSLHSPLYVKVPGAEKISASVKVLLSTASTLVKIRWHTENQLPGNTSGVGEKQ